MDPMLNLGAVLRDKGHEIHCTGVVLDPLIQQKALDNPFGIGGGRQSHQECQQRHGVQCYGGHVMQRRLTLRRDYACRRSSCLCVSIFEGLLRRATGRSQERCRLVSTADECSTEAGVNLQAKKGEKSPTHRR